MNEVKTKSLLAEIGLWDENLLGELQDALFTTYEPPDTRFLINRLLPQLLLHQGPPEDGGETRSVVQLEDRLSHMPEKPIIVSSFRTNDDATKDAWLWGHIQHYPVGARKSACQHSKIWIFKWKAEGKDTLEVVISSCNLTSDSLSAQQQGIWRCVVPISTSSGFAAGWTVLPEFLNELADSCNHPEIRRFSKLLDFARCPKNVEFIASVPGDNPGGKWGWTALQKVCPKNSRVTVVAPSVGYWSSADLKRMMPGTLAWIRDAQKWNLPKSTLKEINKPKSTWRIHELQWPIDGNDSRWLHAKLYFLQNGNWRRLLITSANFSPSAWGPKNIRNFEFGVLIRDELPFDLNEPKEGIDWGLHDEPPDTITDCGWAEAEWDGKKLTVRCRTNLKVRNLEIKYSPMDSRRSDSCSWRSEGGLMCAEIFTDLNGAIPLAVRITLDNATHIEVPVMDLGTDPGTEAMNGLGLAKALIEQIRMEVLFERYGGSPPQAGDTRPDSHSSDAGKQTTSDYRLPAFVDARTAFAILDCWRGKYKEETDKRLRDILLHDGKRFQEYYLSQSHGSGDNGRQVAFKLVAESFEIRLPKTDKGE